MADLFWLSDAQWAVVERFMPRNQPWGNFASAVALAAIVAFWC